MSSFGPWERPPAIFGPAVAGQTVRRDNVVMMPLTLVPTTEPVWPEDEDREREANGGRDLPGLAPKDIAFQMTRELRVTLPDRLFGQLVKLPANDILDTESYDYVAFSVPTSIFGPTTIVPRRMRVELALGSNDRVELPLLPVACALHPKSQVVTDIMHIGEFKIDLGGAFQAAMGTFWPGIPPVFTARTGGALDVKRIKARIQATGQNLHRCEWLIADTQIAYDFTPACIVQVPKGEELVVSAALHVEARQKIAVALYRNYSKSADPVKYVLSAPGSRSSGNSEVTLRRPGVQYADEKSMFSFNKSESAVTAHSSNESRSEDLAWADPNSELNNVVRDALKYPPDLVTPLLTDEQQIALARALVARAALGIDAEEGASNADSASPFLPLQQRQVFLGTDSGAYTEETASTDSSVPEVGSRDPASVLDQLDRLASLLDRGLLTREEFEQLKAKLISGA
jgi:Short C-terminal domain